MKTITNIINLAFALIAVASLGLTASVRAVTPPPDGGYPNGNTAEGQDALFSLGIGTSNTAVGFLSLNANTRGNFNTGIGAAALLNNKDASENTAVGAGALQITDNFLNGGARNTGVGAFALVSNREGRFNTAIGNRTLFNSVSGSSNIGVGANAGVNVTTANNVICIGADGSNTNNSCFIGQIFGANSPGGTAVFINANGKLGIATSSRRFKEEIKPMDRASEVLFALKPVTFQYKKELDPRGIHQFGLVAEDVETIDPDLVVRDKEGKINTVRYEAINAMLLNEFLKEHQKVEQMQKQIEALAAVVQKVSAQLELSKSAPQVVNNP